MGNQQRILFLATSLCDRMGLCTSELSNIIHWLNDCYQKKVLSEGETGLPLSKIGSLEFIEKLVEMIVKRGGFGELLALGTLRASIEMGPAAEEIGRSRLMPSGYVNDSYGCPDILNHGPSLCHRAPKPYRTVA